ncbi:MAG: hypothetical protein AB7V16_07425 [Vulcanibacillus sp.]
MVHNNKYEISISLEDQELDSIPSNFSFTQKDSIFNLYPTASLKFNDIQGHFSEYLSFINGTKINITYGLPDEYFSCDYAIIKNSIPDQQSIHSFGGISEMSLLHYYSFNQSKKSFAYKDEISNIIKKITPSFTDRKIEVTENKGVWYQSLITDADFMENYLLPFAYSSTSSKTPFFLFIDSNNTFHFQSYASLFSQKPVEDLQFTKKGTPESAGKNSIHALFPYQSSLSEIRHTIHSYYSQFKKDKVFDINEDIINDFIYQGKQIPIISNIDNVMDYQTLYSDDVEDVDIKNNNLGLRLFQKRNNFTVDKLVVAINLNKNLCSGKKVNILLPTFSDKEIEELSARYSGEYLIESSYHIWSSTQGSTILILSRQGSRFPSSYRNIKKLIQ